MTIKEPLVEIDWKRLALDLEAILEGINYPGPIMSIEEFENLIATSPNPERDLFILIMDRL